MFLFKSISYNTLQIRLFGATQFNQAAIYDASKNDRDVDFKVGDRVWLYTPQVKKGLTSKLSNLWNGPYRIIRKPKDVNIELEGASRRKSSYMYIGVNSLKAVNLDQRIKGPCYGHYCQGSRK